MPLVLVPMVGAEQVVPIIALAGDAHQHRPHARIPALRRLAPRRRSCSSARSRLPRHRLWLYAADRQGRAARDRHHADADACRCATCCGAARSCCSDRGLVVGSVGYGAAVGGTVGAGVILLSLLMAAGLAGQAVIATDAVLSIVIGGVAACRCSALAGAITAQDDRLRAADRGRGVSRRVPGQGLRRAAADPCAHRDPRRGGAARRRGDGVRRAELRVISSRPLHHRRHRRQDRIRRCRRCAGRRSCRGRRAD